MVLELSTRLRLMHQLQRALFYVKEAERGAFRTQIEHDRAADARMFDSLTLALACIHSARDAAADHIGLKPWLWKVDPPRGRMRDLTALVWLRNQQHHSHQRLYDVNYFWGPGNSHVVWAARNQLPKVSSGGSPPAVFHAGAKAYAERLAHDYVSRGLWSAAHLLQDLFELRHEEIVEAAMYRYWVEKRVDPRRFFAHEWNRAHGPAFARPIPPPGDLLVTVFLHPGDALKDRRRREDAFAAAMSRTSTKR